MLTSDSSLERALARQLDAEAPSMLSSMTNFEWEQFGFVPEGTPVSTIESVFGERIVTGDRYLSSTNLFVFRRDGRVVRAIMVSLDRFDNRDAGRLFGPSVRVGKDPTRPGLLRFS